MSYRGQKNVLLYCSAITNKRVWIIYLHSGYVIEEVKCEQYFVLTALLLLHNSHLLQFGKMHTYKIIRLALKAIFVWTKVPSDLFNLSTITLHRWCTHSYGKCISHSQRNCSQSFFVLLSLTQLLTADALNTQFKTQCILL